MAINRAWGAVTASGSVGAQTIKRGQHIQEVNREGVGTYHVHLDDDLVNPSGYACVRAAINAGDVTHRYIDYALVSRRQVTLYVVTDARTGQDVDFSFDILSDNDTSIAA